MTRPDLDARGQDTRFHVQQNAQDQKMKAAAGKHANTIRGNTEANAGGINRETGDRKARTNDRATNGGE